MKLSRPVPFYVVLCLNLLLVFLSAFSDKLQIPGWLVPAGRMHPLVLHFPLALLLVTIAIYISRKPLGIVQQEIFHLLFYLSALTAALTALFGLFLSREGGYDDDLLWKHQWMGVAISLLSLLIVILLRSGSADLYLYPSMLLTIPVLIIGSHFGGVLTHGEDFLQKPDEPVQQQVAITDSSVVYAALVEPILASKCYSCHNEKKAKGELIMTSVEALLKGGKNGELWIPGDPLNSHIIQRMDLPEEDKKHMPPRGKTQLTDREKKLIHAWIQFGADTEKRFVDYAPADSFRIMLASYMPKQGRSYSFPPADATAIKAVNTPYCVVAPVAIGSPALQARFLIRSGYDVKYLRNLEKVQDQVVDINLSNMTVKDEHLEILKSFRNLETLNLNATDVNGPGLVHLVKLPKLHSISLSNTRIDAKAMEILGTIPTLRNVYCWNTVVDSTMAATLHTRFRNIHWNIGYVPDPNELLQLTIPQLVDAEKLLVDRKDTIALKHPMPGVVIKYTVDGTPPDSLRSETYRKPLSFTRATRLRAIAIRPGWLTSDTADYSFFVRSFKPSRFRLLTPADSNYRAKGDSSLFDGKKGEMNNIKDNNWIGVQKNDLVVFAAFDEPRPVNVVVVSALKKTGPYIMPPEKIELWAGNDSTAMRPISSITPLQPRKYEADKIEIHELPVNGTYRYYRIKVHHIKKLPAWHEGKGKKGWAFVDEIFFN